MKTETLHTEQDTSLDLWKLIGESVAILWKDWPKDMQLSYLAMDGSQFVVQGECPHCRTKAAFESVTRPYHENPDSLPDRIVAACQCIACNRYILAIILTHVSRGAQIENVCEEYYPVGLPDETLDNSIPPDVAGDVREAIRCQWMNAHRACVVMCRRALETSVIAMGANGPNLLKRIDDLATKGAITETLKQFAHEVRLTGNAGAHSDGLTDIQASDADDIMAFTSQYLEHVYVMPARLAARRAAAKGKTP